jgi:hypothetical protein
LRGFVLLDVNVLDQIHTGDRWIEQPTRVDPTNVGGYQIRVDYKIGADIKQLSIPG